MKRILHIVGTMDRAGAETMIMNLYRVMDKTQIQFDFLYFTSKKCDFDEEIEELGGQIYRIIESNPIKRMLSTTKLLKENHHWTTIHAHTLFSNAFHIFAAYKAGVKQRISHSHTISTQFKNKFIGTIYSYLSRKMQQKYVTDFVACTSEAGQYLFPYQKNVLILKNSIDIEYFAATAKNNEKYLREQFNIHDDAVVLLQLGRLSAPKNHQFSIQIARELKRKKIKFKLLFAGEGVLVNHLLEQVESLDLKNEVLFLGLRTDVSHLLAGSDLMLMPSLYEGFGVVLIEAQATGIPSLISDKIPSDADLGINLIYVNSLKESSEVWANRIIEICNKNLFVKEEIRLLKLREFGFDQHNSVEILSELYK
jgi:glycosyltransferase EpsF